MPSAIAGIVAADTARHRDQDLNAMIVAPLAVTARAPGLLALGDARLEERPDGPRLIDGDIEEAVAEVVADAVRLRRDAVGARPLYYAWSADARQLAFASRPTQLFGLPWVDQAVDWEGLLDVLAGEVSDAERTCVAGIRQVPAGHRLEWRPGRVSLVREWDPERFLWDGGRGPGDAALIFAERLQDAVVRRSDDRITIMLSGGLDSTSVAAAARRGGLRPRILSSVFPRFPTVDETDRVLDVCQSLGLEGDLVEVEDRGLALDSELKLHGEPHGAPNYGHFAGILREAAARGCTTLMDGHDGDGALGSMSGLGPLLLRRPRLAWDALAFLVASGRSRRETLRAWAGQCMPPLARHAFRSVRPRQLPAFAWAGPEILDRVRPPEVDRWRRAQLAAVGPRLGQSITLLDRTAAELGLDVRHPFADRELLEFLLSLPPEVKHAGGRWKALARDGFPELPGSVRNRASKTHFNDAAEAVQPLEVLAPMLRDPPVPVPGIDYDALHRRLDSGAAYAPGELRLMRALALTHRFLAMRC